MNRCQRLLAALPAVVSLTAGAAAPEEAIYGWVEKMRLEPLGIEVKAKLDTGALTSSIHATDIEPFEKGGEKWVRFTISILDEENEQTVRHELERPLVRNIRVRGAGGEERRPVVRLGICAGDDIYHEQFSLKDRSDMLYPMLIGRRTIQHLGVVDVTRTFIKEPTCDGESGAQLSEERGADQDLDT